MRDTMTVRRGALAVALAVLAACACALAFVPSALAADQGTTRQLDGLSYTLPSDWEQVDAEAVLDGLVDAVDAEGLDLEGLETVVFFKEDGFFLGACVPGAGDIGGEDTEGLAAELAAVSAYAQTMLEGTPLAAVSISGAMEQGCPALTASTTDIAFNGVTYALTVKLFLGAGASGEDAVLMLSFLPASGQVTKNFAASLEALEQPAAIEVSGVSYDVPAGVSLATGSIFGYDFAVATGSEGADCVLFAAGIPSVEDLAGVTMADLDELAVEIYDAVLADDELTSDLTAFWSGAYDFLGFPTIGVEGQLAADEEDTEAYFCLTASFTPAGISVLAMVQDPDATFADEVLGSAAATVAPDASVSDGDADGSGVDVGFVVGLPAAA